MKIIQDLWILTESGTVLFSRTFQEDVDVNLFGAMMSSLNTFAGELSEGGLTSFELQNKTFSLLKRQGCIFIANYAEKKREKKVISELNKISEKFLSKYKEELKHFEGEVSLFSEFELEIEDSLDHVVDKFQKGFW